MPLGTVFTSGAILDCLLVEPALFGALSSDCRADLLKVLLMVRKGGPDIALKLTEPRVLRQLSLRKEPRAVRQGYLGVSLYSSASWVVCLKSRVASVAAVARLARDGLAPRHGPTLGRGHILCGRRQLQVFGRRQLAVYLGRNEMLEMCRDKRRIYCVERNILAICP